MRTCAYVCKRADACVGLSVGPCAHAHVSGIACVCVCVCVCVGLHVCVRLRVLA